MARRIAHRAHGPADAAHTVGGERSARRTSGCNRKLGKGARAAPEVEGERTPGPRASHVVEIGPIGINMIFPNVYVSPRPHPARRTKRAATFQRPSDRPLPVSRPRFPASPSARSPPPSAWWSRSPSFISLWRAAAGATLARARVGGWVQHICAPYVCARAARYWVPCWWPSIHGPRRCRPYLDRASFAPFEQFEAPIP